jgi:hypothetical protein
MLLLSLAKTLWKFQKSFIEEFSVMPTMYKIINAKDFIKAKPSGATDLEQSKQLLLELAMIAGLSPDYNILSDVRDSYGNLTHNELNQLLLVLVKHREFFKNKIALLTRNDEQFNRAAFFEICGNIEGFNIAAFIDYEKAINWLNSDGGLDELFE